MKKVFSLVVVLVLVMGLSLAYAEKLGLGSSTGATWKDVNAAEKKDGAAQVNTFMCALLLDDAGKIVNVKFDVVQTKLAISGEAKMVTDLAAPIKTKVELGDAYGMAKAAKAGEWYVQAAAFEKYCIGKTVDEVLATKVYAKDDHHKQVPDVADLKTTVTIDIGEFLESLKAAAANAK